MPTLALLAAAASYLVQLGAGIFALSVIGRVVVSAPPRSFSLLGGPYGYDSSGFWQVMPVITGVLLLVALVTNWKTRRRALLLGALAMFVGAGILTGMFLEPLFAGIIAGGYRDAVDVDLQRRASTWYSLDWGLRVLDAAAGVALLVALTRRTTDQA